jgi:orotate phosphoribosyltransferase
MSTAKTIAHELLACNAVKLSPSNPFKWASGWNSPIYCDNRKTLSYPAIRSLICSEFVKLITAQFPTVEVIAGVATGAIAQGALVANQMQLPMVYVRSEAKKHGLENLVEGVVNAGQKVVVVEDLISTGGSSLKAVEALRGNGCEVLGMTAIFTYGFKNAEDNFTAANCKLFTLTNYSSLIELAVESGYVKASDVDLLNRWRETPDKWPL